MTTEFVLGAVGGSALVADASDPNASAPVAARICTTPPAVPGQQLNAIIVTDSAATLEGWYYSKAIGKWLKLFSQATSTAFVTISLTNGISLLPIPDGVPFFLRVVTPGSAAMAAIRFH